MKVALTAKQPSLDAMVDEEFGRCRHFLVVDSETMEFVDVSGERAAAGGCAGAASAQLAGGHGAAAVVLGHCGPGALAALQGSGLAVYYGAGQTVREAVRKLAAGELESVGSPNCSSAAAGGCCHGH